ncbi:violaceus kinesin [Aspergillus granulosus]|uniref:Violaceus kinesin n=1 Tax=Aspergillus granulosus TaxID=176169 RepID=A0ABR4HVF7_9EURO
MMFTHASYTVAWICALPLELAAAKVFLDEVHPRLTQPKSDHNVYTLGSVSGHNIVVVCLPAGVYGTTSATAAVAYLKSTYPNIQFGLMVGIGGGVPRGNPDIRLGDIVVSKPTDTFGGVIQYDYGKTLRNGQFHYTGSLNKPPPILLKAIAQMESDNMLGQVSLTNLMGSFCQTDDIRKQFPRPAMDQLFRSTYNHVGDTPGCSACDQDQIVDRPKRTTEEPHIHYGLVASGNQVIKDARTRDLIAQDRNILCFEMEAAGLMDEIPSLVIRGICDYCDSHKHKEWQPYAAFVAAAYARAVLIQVPLHDQNAELKESTRPHWVVPFRRNPNFVGREEEIAEVEELLRKRNVSKVAICGLGGAGKTQIALELAYRVRERDPTCFVFWIPCTSYATVEQAYMDIAETIGFPEIKSADAEQRVKTYLSQAIGNEWLLIFDNADDMDMWVGDSAGATDLASLLPQSERGHIIFTTRNRKLAVRLASPFVVEVSEPDAETAVRILEKALLRNDLCEDSDETITLLEQLMFLPLAISQAAAYINSNDIKVSDYTALLKEQESDIIDLLSEDFGDDRRYQEIQNPVATTWLISFQEVQRLNPLAADYLWFMACINPRDIPQSLLPEATSRKKMVEAIGLLKAFSFVSEQVKNHALSLHRLVHLATRNWLRRQRQFSMQIQKVADRLDQVFPNNNHENQRIWREYLPHALSLVGERDFQNKQEKYTSLVWNIGRCLQAEGRYQEAAVLFEDIVQLQKRERGDDDPLTLTSMADLASTYRNQGRWKESERLEVQVMEGRWKEAEELGMQVMEIRSRVLGTEHPDTLTSMANLAHTFYSKDNIHDAVLLMEKCVRLRESLLGPSHPHTISSAFSLREWKETVDSPTQNHQSPVQAENDRPIGGIPQGSCSPAVVITKPAGNRGLFNHQGLPVRPATPLRFFFESHPLLLASQDGSPAMPGQDLHEVD